MSEFMDNHENHTDSANVTDPDGTETDRDFDVQDSPSNNSKSSTPLMTILET